MLRSHDRFPYHPWAGRPQWSWPNGAKLALYLGVNLEHFSFGEGMGAELAPGGPQPAPGADVNSALNRDRRRGAVPCTLGAVR